MTCTGNQNPLRLLYVTCNVSRSPTYVRPFTDLAVVGDEQWERSSGKGRLVWGEGPYDGGVEGTLQIQFDDPARNFCQLDIHGGTSGQELVDRWWRDAPL